MIVCHKLMDARYDAGLCTWLFCLLKAEAKMNVVCTRWSLCPISWKLFYHNEGEEGRKHELQETGVPASQTEEENLQVRVQGDLGTTVV